MLFLKQVNLIQQFGLIINVVLTVIITPVSIVDIFEIYNCGAISANDSAAVLLFATGVVVVVAVRFVFTCSTNVLSAFSNVAKPLQNNEQHL